MIRFADDSMIDSLKNIWSESFGDSRAYIDMYFRNRFSSSETLVYLDGAMPVAMMTVMPVDITVNRIAYKAGYIYAVATMPSHRSRGISGRLMEYALNHMSVMGLTAAILVPAQPSLFDFYYKMGYRNLFGIKSVRLESEEIPARSAFSVTSITAETMLRLRDGFFNDGRLFVKWTLDMLEYHIYENQFTGGDILGLRSDICEGYALCARYKDNVVIKELAVDDGRVMDALAAIKGRYGASEYTVRLKGDSIAFQTHKRRFGMLKWLSQPLNTMGYEPYMALVLD